jgi:hypothetical protein
VKPLPPAVTQAIIAAINGNWRGVIDSAQGGIQGQCQTEFGAPCAPIESEFTPGAIPWGGLAGWGIRIGGWADAAAGLLPFLLLVETGDNPVHHMSNTSENRKFDWAVQEIERRCGRALSKGDRRRLHDEITGGDHSVPDIIDIGVGMFCPGS